MLFRSQKYQYEHVHGLEVLVSYISADHREIVVAVLYRPPKQDVPQFLGKLRMLLSRIPVSTLPCVITGDFNLHIDVSSQRTNQFLDILSSFDLQQHVKFPTHIHGHSLDLLIGSASCSFFYQFFSLIAFQITSLSLPR